MPLLRSLRSLHNGRHLQLQAIPSLHLSPHRPRLVEKRGVARSGRGYAPSLARSYLICAVWATPSALRPISLLNNHRFTLSPLLVGVRSRAQWLRLRSGTAFRFRCMPLLRSLRSLHNGRHLQLQAIPSLHLSPHRPRLVEKRGVARSGRGYAPSLARSYLICAVWATPSALLQSPYKIVTASRCRHCSWVLLGRGRLSLPSVALPLSPSLASPPPSLRSGTSPQGGFYMSCGCCASSVACRATPSAAFPRQHIAPSGGGLAAPPLLAGRKYGYPLCRGCIHSALAAQIYRYPLWASAL